MRIGRLALDLSLKISGLILVMVVGMFLLIYADKIRKK